MDAILAEIAKRGWAVDIHCNERAGHIYARIYEWDLRPGFLETHDVHGATVHEALWGAFVAMTRLVEQPATEKAEG